jgi:hypothetical protein
MNLDRRRARSSSPHAALCFVAKLATVVASELRTTGRGPVPDFMATVASPVKPSRRRVTGLQCRRSRGLAAKAVLGPDKNPRRLLLVHAARRIENSRNLKGMCPRGNNKVVIIIFYIYDKCLFLMLELY